MENGDLYTSQNYGERVVSEEELKKLKQDALISHILFLVGLAIPISFLVSVIYAYIRKDASENTWVMSHFNWIIKSFWGVVLGTVLSVLFFFFGIGVLIAVLVEIYAIYRGIKGIIALRDQKELPNKWI